MQDVSGPEPNHQRQLTSWPIPVTRFNLLMTLEMIGNNHFNPCWWAQKVQWMMNDAVSYHHQLEYTPRNQDLLYQPRASEAWQQQPGSSGDLCVSRQCGEPIVRSGHVKSHIRKGRPPFITLKNIWRSHLVTNAKNHLFNSNFKSLLQHGAETWRTTNTIKKQLI